MTRTRGSGYSGGQSRGSSKVADKSFEDDEVPFLSTAGTALPSPAFDIGPGVCRRITPAHKCGFRSPLLRADGVSRSADA